MIKKASMLVAFALVTAMGGVAVVEGRDHFTGACATELNAVEAAVQNGLFVGRNATSDQSNLLAKLEAAAAKIGMGKFDDAVDKLQDIADTATALTNAPKPKLEDASQINNAIVSTIGCVAGLAQF